MIRGSSRSRNFFKKLVVNGVSNSKAAIQNDCLMRLYDADAELKAISTELDSFDGKKDPIRCNLLVNQLRTAQDKVISLLFQLMDECNCERASRDYRMKFPDEILLSEGSESLNGQIWFGAECLSAGSNILNHTKESTMLRPMAKTLTTSLDSLRNDLRELVTDGGGASRINQALIEKMVIFDHIFARFEYEYVRTMLPIRTVAEIEKLQEVAVLFSETLIDCVKRGLIKQDDIDEFQPIVMIAIPRLAIVRGLLYKNENPIYTRHKSQMCSLFQPFHGPLHSIRKLLRGLSLNELFNLEKMLANDQTAIESPLGTLQKKQQKDQINQECSNDSGDQTRKDISNDSNPSSRCELDDENEASTSNNYSNVLMNRLQYPVQKTGVEEIEVTNCLQDTEQQQQPTYECGFDGTASSSKSIVANTEEGNSSPKNNSPAGTSPSTTSTISSSLECKRCVDKTDSAECQKIIYESHEICDKNCLPPTQDNDAQLEKLIADFGPSMNNQDSLPASTTNNEVIPVVPQSSTTPTQRDKNIHREEQSSKLDRMKNNEVMEELFIKQAQQLLHRLFVAISGVADQLQSNFASDLRFILKHIFSSDSSIEDDKDKEENIDEEDDDESNDYYTRENSDGSPIEQAIEAREVANLIDLSSSYSLENNYRFDNDVGYLSPAPPPTTHFPYPTNEVSDVEVNHYSPTSSFYVSNGQQQLDSNDNNQNSHHNHRVQQTLSASSNAQLTAAAESQNYDYYEDGATDFMRLAEELTPESRTSPNEPSLMDDSRHHRHLVQQHMQSSVTSGRQTTRSSSSRSHRTNDGSTNQLERRSRHHRSRRQRGPPVWVPDQLVVACSCCNVAFTLFRRRHHCRACGQIFCADCSKFTKNLNCWGYNGPVRVCESCFNQP